jgi:hypothetical protein
LTSGSLGRLHHHLDAESLGRSHQAFGFLGFAPGD